ncbi:MAG: hypothetical protein J0I26_13910 [Alphaproteobacteria bacterium]|jgi:hypothetical protein|nr:hypothetical protein [Alphaproteobacteria bacterium]MBN9558614.1 hypothetical protein [Alphaproteobacteria bacterium]MBN9568014.1 hypothetical protein [Alphaproteobacteria bacterium]
MSGAGAKGPPVAHRFRKGTSGNPKGRPRESTPETARSAFDIVVERTLTITRGGVERDVTLEEALQHRTYQDALAGNRPARREILRMIAKREKWLSRKHTKVNKLVERKIVSSDPDNAHQALLLLGIARLDPKWAGDKHDEYERLLLEPWAVQAALRRRRGGHRLTDKEKAEIIRCTSDAGTLRWPRGTTP